VWAVSGREFTSLLKQNSSIAFSVLTSAIKRLYADTTRTAP
jgi:hypothetical protein